VKCHVDDESQVRKTKSEQNGKLIKWLIKWQIWGNGKLMKCQVDKIVDEVANWRNGKLMKW
jgi:hypothetical protein